MTEQVINFGAAGVECSECILSGVMKRVTVAIAPIKVVRVHEPERDEYIVFQGCNLYRACGNKTCAYSEVSRDAAAKRY